METELPGARGPLSEVLIERLREPAPAHGEPEELLAARAEDGVFGEDFQLSLYVLYELHYRGFAGVDEHWEWQPSLLGLRCELEADFEAALRERLRADDGSADPAKLGQRINALIDSDEGPQLSVYMERSATLDQFR